MSTDSFHKTRLAPTPSGFLHIGNAFSFALTAALAKRNNASVLLRIDDMDRERADRKYLKDIFETLRFLEIPWNEGPNDADDFEAHFSQRHRLSLYEENLAKLVGTGKVYACDCSRKDIFEKHDGIYPGTCKHKNIPLITPNVAWRIDTGNAGEIEMIMPDGKNSAELPPEMRHFIIRKKDGFPAYQITSLTDDLYYGIDLIVRGEDLRPSTLAQLYLAKLLGTESFSSAIFYHHPLLTDSKKRKLSKSEGDTSIRYLISQGMLKKDIFEIIGRQFGQAFERWEDFDGIIS